MPYFHASTASSILLFLSLLLLLSLKDSNRVFKSFFLNHHSWVPHRNTTLMFTSAFSVKSYLKWIDTHKGPSTKYFSSFLPLPLSQCITISCSTLIKLAFMRLAVKLSLSLSLALSERLRMCVISVKSLQSSHWLC